MNKTRGLLLAAGIVLATAFTFSGCKEEAKDKPSATVAETDAVALEKLQKKGDVYYLNNVPFTGKARKDEDCCTEEWEMKDGKFHGKYEGDYPNSNYAGTYKDGKKHGEWIINSDGADGAGKVIEHYKDGKKHGEWTWTSWGGKLYQTETYEDDKLIKGWEETMGTFTYTRDGKKLPSLTPYEIREFASEGPTNDGDAYPFHDDPNGKYYHFWSFVGDGDSQWDGLSYSEEFTATSTLAPQGKINYKAENLQNNTKVGGIRGTTWCDGVKGYGTGERITMSIRTQAEYKDVVSFHGLLIVNGYANTAATWKKNTRVKTLRLYVGGKAWCDLQLSDVMKPQFFQLLNDLRIFPAISGKVVSKGSKFPAYQTDLTFEIIEVYPGDKYDDTCITGIALDILDGGVY